MSTDGGVTSDIESDVSIIRVILPNVMSSSF